MVCYTALSQNKVHIHTQESWIKQGSLLKEGTGSDYVADAATC